MFNALFHLWLTNVLLVENLFDKAYSKLKFVYIESLALILR